MPLFTIDETKCNKDGICAVECPAHVIRMTEDRPEPVEQAMEYCIQCGHCVAVCPQGALALESLSPEDCLPMEKERGLDADQAAHFLRSRRSIRRYKDKAVPRELFEKALGIACCAPTGSNKQPVKWLVIDQKETVTRVAGHVIDWMKAVLQKSPETGKMLNMDVLTEQWDRGIDRICRDAPQLVFAYAANDIGSAAADCHTALAYLELALTGFGLGSCWAGYVNYAASQWPALQKELSLPQAHTCHGALMVGFPKFRYYRAPRRKAPDLRYHG